jgi:hypothetical protein
VCFVLADVVFLQPLFNYTTTPENSFFINATINDNNLKTVIYSWNFTNFTLYDESLILMHNFDNVSTLGENSTYVVDASKYSNNATAINGAFWNSSGKYNGAYQFDGSNDQLRVNDVSTLSFVNNQSFTIELWLYPNSLSSSAYDKIFGKGAASNYEYVFRLFKTTPNFILWGLNGADECNLGATSNISINTWQYVTIVFNGSNCYYYYNGNFNSNATRVVSVSAGDGNQPLLIGSAVDGAGQGYFNGSIDEFKIWNRSFSSAEVYEHYVSNLQKFNSTQWRLSVNQSGNTTIGLVDGNYSYQVFSTNASNVLSNSTLRYVYVDTVAPVVNITSLINGTTVYSTVDINYTDVDATLDSCWYSNSSGVWNSTSVLACVNWSNVLFNDGTYNLTVYCNDSAGHTSSSTVYFIKATTSNNNNGGGATGVTGIIPKLTIQLVPHFYKNNTEIFYITDNSLPDNIAFDIIVTNTVADEITKMGVVDASPRDLYLQTKINETVSVKRNEVKTVATTGIMALNNNTYWIGISGKDSTTGYIVFGEYYFYLDNYISKSKKLQLTDATATAAEQERNLLDKYFNMLMDKMGIYLLYGAVVLSIIVFVILLIVYLKYRK